MGNLKQCQNGHYYDPNMYPSCPYCSNASAAINRSVDNPSVVNNYEFKTAMPGATQAPGFNDGGLVRTQAPESTVAGNFSNVAYSTDLGVTAPPINSGTIQDTSKTIALVPRPKNDTGEVGKDEAKLVVGWLVAVEGPYLGKSFELFHGYTYIGRERGDIILKHDKAISAEKNVGILYSEKNNRFRVGAGQSKNVVYVNDEELFGGSNVALKAYDRLEFGESKFVFVPFCGEKFQWFAEEKKD